MTHFGLDKKERNYKIEIHKRLHSWLRCTFFLAHCPDNVFMIERLLNCANQSVTGK